MKRKHIIFKHFHKRTEVNVCVDECVRNKMINACNRLRYNRKSPQNLLNTIRGWCANVLVCTLYCILDDKPIDE